MLIQEATKLSRRKVLRWAAAGGLGACLLVRPKAFWLHGQQAEPLEAAERDRRLQRTPSALANQLAGQYGQTLTSPVYTLSFSVLGRLLLGQDVGPLLQPLLAKDQGAGGLTASHYSGHLVFAAWAKHLPPSSPLRPEAVQLVLRMAEAAMANPLDNEMSDSVFMVCPLLAEAATLSGQARFRDAAAAHFAKMERVCRRPDGLYRHSPLCEAAWGRGNAFPLLGMALAMQADRKLVRRLHAPYEQLATTLVRRQDEQGMWHQVVDNPQSYAEYSATAMVGRALAMGVQNHWLPKGFTKSINAAWRAVNLRTGFDGAVMGVCESTGKQSSEAAYLQRKAIFGRDERGGAMGLLLAVTLANAGKSR